MTDIPDTFRVLRNIPGFDSRQWLKKFREDAAKRVLNRDEKEWAACIARFRRKLERSDPQYDDMCEEQEEEAFREHYKECYDADEPS